MMVGRSDAEIPQWLTTRGPGKASAETTSVAGSSATTAIRCRWQPPRFSSPAAVSVTTEDQEASFFPFSLLSRPSLFSSCHFLPSPWCARPLSFPGTTGPSDPFLPAQLKDDSSSLLSTVCYEEAACPARQPRVSTLPRDRSEARGAGACASFGFPRRHCTSATCSGGQRLTESVTRGSTLPASITSAHSGVGGEGDCFCSNTVALAGLPPGGFRALLPRLGFCFTEDPKLDSCCTAAGAAIYGVLTAALSRTAQAGGRLADLAGYYYYSHCFPPAAPSERERRTYAEEDLHTRGTSTVSSQSAAFQKLPVSSSFATHLPSLPVPPFYSGELGAAFASAVSAFTTALRHLKFGEGEEGSELSFSPDFCPRRARRKAASKSDRDSAALSPEREGEQHTAGYREEDITTRQDDTSKRQRLRIRRRGFCERTSQEGSYRAHIKVQRTGYRCTYPRPSHHLSVYACAAAHRTWYASGIYKRRRLGSQGPEQKLERGEFLVQADDAGQHGNDTRHSSGAKVKEASRLANEAAFIVRRKPSGRRGTYVECVKRQGGSSESPGVDTPRHDGTSPGTIFSSLCRKLSPGSDSSHRHTQHYRTSTGGTEEERRGLRLEQEDLSWTRCIPLTPAALSRANSSWSVETVDSPCTGCTPISAHVTPPPSPAVRPPVFSTSAVHCQLRRRSSSSLAGEAQTLLPPGGHQTDNLDGSLSSSNRLSPRLLLLPSRGASSLSSSSSESEEGERTRDLVWGRGKRAVSPIVKEGRSDSTTSESLRPRSPGVPEEGRSTDTTTAPSAHTPRKPLVTSRSTHVLCGSSESTRRDSSFCHHRGNIADSEDSLRRSRSASDDTKHLTDIGFRPEQRLLSEDRTEGEGGGGGGFSRPSGCKAFFFPPFVRELGGIGSLHFGGRRLRNPPPTAHPPVPNTTTASTSAGTGKSPSPFLLHPRRHHRRTVEGVEEEAVDATGYVSNKGEGDCCTRSRGGSEGGRGGGEEEQGSYQAYLSWHEDKWSERMFDHVEVDDVSIDPLRGAGCVIM